MAGNKLRVTAVDSAPRRRSRSRSRERRRRRSRSRDRDNDHPTPDPANGAVGRIALMNKLANREPVVPEPKVLFKFSAINYDSCHVFSKK